MTGKLRSEYSTTLIPLIQYFNKLRPTFECSHMQRFDVNIDYIILVHLDTHEKGYHCCTFLNFTKVRSSLLDFLISLALTTAPSQKHWISLTFLNSHDKLYGLLYGINNANKRYRTPSSGYRLDCSWWMENTWDKNTFINTFRCVPPQIFESSTFSVQLPKKTICIFVVGRLFALN